MLNIAMEAFIGHVNEYPRNSGHIQSMIAFLSLREYYWKFLLENSIVGMLSTCPIGGLGCLKTLIFCAKH